MGDVRRREFITLLGAAAAWPHPAVAQGGGSKKVGLLLSGVETDPEARAGVAAFERTLQELGWSVDRNLHIDARWAGADLERAKVHAAELVSLSPDVILASNNLMLVALQGVTTTVPIVFVAGSDPVGRGFIKSLARPGGNITGFTTFEYAISGKWVETLREVAPHTVSVGVTTNPQSVDSPKWLSAIQVVSRPLGLLTSAIEIRQENDLEAALQSFAREPNGALIVPPNPFASVQRQKLIELTARHRLPTIYPFRFFVTGGGLMSYGIDTTDLFPRGATYVHRILRGQKAADLPVQAPNKFDLAINLKTAKTLGLEIPATLIARADEVIE
jgi:putative ABC transport system substrate-binding protein